MNKIISFLFYEDDPTFNNMISSIGSFCKEHSDTLLKGALMAVGSKFGVKMDFGSADIVSIDGKKNKVKFNIPYNCNAQERAIVSIVDTVSKSDWDSSKSKAAKDIFDIAVSNKNESTVRTAIAALEHISKKCDWNSNKAYVNDLIKKLAMGGNE